MTLTQFFAAQLPVRTEPLNVAAVEKSLAAFLEAEEPRQRVRAAMLADVPALDPEMPLSGVEDEDRKRVLADVAVLETGNWALGHSDPRLTPFVGGPGLEQLTYWIRQCREAIAGETALRAISWPAPFVFTGRPGTMRFDGRVLRRGDIVHLTRAQFEAFADKVSPVGEEIELTR
jgi:hypothetical protein